MVNRGEDTESADPFAKHGWERKLKLGEKTQTAREALTAMDNDHGRAGQHSMSAIRAILAASGMALGGMFAVVAKEAADADLPWHAVGHSVVAGIAVIAPSAIVLWEWIPKRRKART